MDVITKSCNYSEVRCWMYSVEWQKGVFRTAENGYPLYRRRKPDYGGYIASINLRINNQNQEVEIDNRWVVPYSPILSKIFQAHINVEYCNSVKSIKYICKYINKGSDMAVVQLHNATTVVNDEIAQYQMGRYINSNEAVWRILRFPIHERHPTVVHLSVHLENGQRVYFTTINAHKIAAQPPNSTLTSFLKICHEDPFSKTLLYAEVPKYYTWDKSDKKIYRRKRVTVAPGHTDVRECDALGRVCMVHPNNAECYYLRLLLHNIRGPISFTFQKTVDGKVYKTYIETCLELGLLEDDQHCDSTLIEASVTRFGPQLLNLFSVILTTCAPSNLSALWEKYKDYLSEDILNQKRIENPDLDLKYSLQIYNEALILLEDKYLSISTKTLLQLGLPAPNRSVHDALHRDVLRKTSYNVKSLKDMVKTNKPRLIEDQRTAYEAVMNLVAKGNGGLLFLDAPGGTGKTFLVSLILAEIRAKGDIALSVASSGIASTLLEGGRTAHSALRLTLNLAQTETPVSNISKGSGKAIVLQTCKLIVWDECTMSHKRSLEALDRTMRYLRNNTRIPELWEELLFYCQEIFAKLYLSSQEQHQQTNSMLALKPRDFGDSSKEKS